MPQLTIYMDKETVQKVTRAARGAKLSVSRWISQRLAESLKDTWPASFVDSLGALAETDLQRPEQPHPSDDSDREPL